MNNFHRLLIATVLLPYLSGCSVADMAYNSAPGFVAGEFKEAFDLSAAQSSQLDIQLEAFLPGTVRKN